jgi:HTH-type transcriptional regulator, glycine betaine synthesis regulator
MARTSALPAIESVSTTQLGLVLPGGRAPEVVDFFVSVTEMLGTPKSVAAIYGIVFASAEPLSFAEIESRLNISKGSVSQGLRMLREVGALKEVSGPDDKTELFEPDTELRRLIERFLDTRVKSELQSGGRRLTNLKVSAARLNSPTKILQQRIKKLQAWHDRARALVPFARTFLKLGA